VSESVVSDSRSVENIPVKRILVMDDDESVLATFSIILSQIGHKVEYAKNGSEAIEILMHAKLKGVSFDCVILDLTIDSGVGAEQAIKRILEIDPRVKAILTSGHATHPVIDDYKNHGFHSVLKKPFSLTDVQQVISSVFAKPVGS
jgi:DNA-binding NtrC family response regulator